jgi:outer membrane protein assembly factor BamB
MAGRDAGHSRRVGSGPSEPTTTWATDLEGARAASTPSLADGRLFVPADAVTDRARYRRRIHALDAATGEERWQVPVRGRLNPSPAVVGDTVVVTARRWTREGRILGFRTRFGREEWLYDVDARLTAPPTVDATVVYVPDWAGRVHAIDAGTGTARWTRKIEGEGDEMSFTTPAALDEGGERAFVASTSGPTGVVALDADDGTVRWRRSTPPVIAGPVVSGGLVAVRHRRSVTAYGTDGSRRWGFAVPDRRPRSLAVDDRRVYVAAGERLFAIGRDGEEGWTHVPEESPVGTPTVVGDRLFLRGRDRLAVLDAADGEQLWSGSIPGGGEAVVLPGAAFIMGEGSRVLGLE